MSEMHFNPAVVLFCIGVLVAVAILVKGGLARKGIPALIGFLALGFTLRLVEAQFGILSTQGIEVFEFLAKIGVLVLLFRISLESNIKGLLRQLRRASLFWIADVTCSVGVGFLLSYYVLGLSLIPCLFVATALAATSVGISVGVWQESGALDSPNGELLIDVAELDDISSIVLFAVLFAVVPVLQHGNSEANLLPVLLSSVGGILLKLLLFGAGCYVFSKYLEKPVTSFFHSFQAPPEPMLMVVSIGIMMGALAGLLGFSVAIGAFFAGLVFSDPEAVKIDASFNAIYELFSPFFFIGIGLSIQPEALVTGLKFGSVLLLSAILGKSVGIGLPAFFSSGWKAATLLSFSMIPRAEIAMIVMQRGLTQENAGISSQLYAAMVFVSAVTCLCAPFLIRSLLQTWPQTQGAQET